MFLKFRMTLNVKKVLLWKAVRMDWQNTFSANITNIINVSLFTQTLYDETNIDFAGGVLIIIFKPFKIGDVIEAQGYIGGVESIQIFNTILKTPDNKAIIIPNGPLSNGSITNYSTEETRRVDWTFGIGYDDDLKKAQTLLLKIVNSHAKILKDPETFVRVGELADSSVNFTVRAWVNAVDYWDVHFDIIESVKMEFDKNKISIPYPQTDVHLHQ